MPAGVTLNIRRPFYPCAFCGFNCYAFASIPTRMGAWAWCGICSDGARHMERLPTVEWRTRQTVTRVGVAGAVEGRQRKWARD
jgi:hypothetical protein